MAFELFDSISTQQRQLRLRFARIVLERLDLVNLMKEPIEENLLFAVQLWLLFFGLLVFLVLPHDLRPLLFCTRRFAVSFPTKPVLTLDFVFGHRQYVTSEGMILKDMFRDTLGCHV